MFVIGQYRRTPDKALIICNLCNICILTPVHGIEEDWRDHGKLYDNYLNRMYGRYRPRSWLKVPVMDAVKVFE